MHAKSRLLFHLAFLLYGILALIGVYMPWQHIGEVTVQGGQILEGRILMGCLFVTLFFTSFNLFSRSHLLWPVSLSSAAGLASCAYYYHKITSSGAFLENLAKELDVKVRLDSAGFAPGFYLSLGFTALLFLLSTAVFLVALRRKEGRGGERNRPR